MKLIHDTLTSLRTGRPQHWRALKMVPLKAAGPFEAAPDYLLLDDALETGLATVSEISDKGSVPELLFDNTATQSVLLLDGEELVGAKQNRVLNLTVIVPAQSELVIPVSCVEQGRWSHDAARHDQLDSADRTFNAAGRARKAADVSLSMAREGSRRGDQGAVWEEVGDSLDRLSVDSPTHALADAFESHGVHIDQCVAAFHAVSNQVGAVFSIAGQPVGLEVFDHPRSFARLMPKLLRSYGLDALNTPAPIMPPPRGLARGFVKQAAEARYVSFPAVGDGEDHRLGGDRLSGGAVSLDGRVVHLCAFNVGSAARTHGDYYSTGQMSPAQHRLRRRYRS